MKTGKFPLYRRIRSLLGRDDTLVTVILLLGFGIVLVAIDTLSEPPKWEHVLADLHSVFIEIALIAVVAAVWVQARERQHWRVVRPLIEARVLRACNAAIEAVQPGLQRQYVYQIGDYDVACSFELDRLWPVSLFYDGPRENLDSMKSPAKIFIKNYNGRQALALRTLAEMFVVNESSHSQVLQIRSKIGQAQTLVDSALNLATLAVNRGVEAEEVADISRLQYVLSAFLASAESIAGNNFARKDRTDAEENFGSEFAQVVDTAFLVGGPLAVGAKKTTPEDAKNARLERLKSRLRQQIEMRTGQGRPGP